MTPKKLFTTFAIAEAITWTLLLVGMFLKYVTRTTEVMVSVGGGLHGFVFLMYCVVTVLVGTSQRWSAGRTLMGLLSAVIPYVTIPFEISVRRAGLLDGGWQLAPGGREPRGWFERLCSLAIARPVLAAVIGVVVVALVFTAMLMAGPPVQVA